MAEWDDLRRELDLWAASDRRATLWWRDDDAGPDDGRLAGLLRRRRDLGVPLALAVVPDWLVPASAALLRADPGASVLQHGWCHLDRAAPGQRKCELTSHGGSGELEAGLAAGQSALAHALGARFHAVMVPPWNRIDEEIADRLAPLGFAGLSTLGPRPARRRFGLALANVHVDIVDWRGSRGFVGERAALTAACDHLARRRAGTVAADEPTGLMTHHRDHDGACDGFVERFVATTRDHGATWLDAAAVFTPAGA